MKKIAFMLALSVAVMASCQKNEELPIVSEKEVFTASVESFDAQTKTSMTQDRQVVWSQDDRLAIFQGSTLADEYKVTDVGEGNANATFVLVTDNSEVNGSVSAGVEVSRNIALYPYTDDLLLEASILDDEGSAYEITGFVLPSTQNYAADSFGNGSFPMVAVTGSISDHTLKFRNLLGAMKLQFKGTQTVKSIKVEGKNNEKLSGAATITAYATNLTPAITMDETASTSVTLDCGDGVQLNESTATDFFIALPPVLFSQGFAVTVVDSESNEKVIQTDVNNAVLRSSILTMPVVNLTAAGGGESEEDDDATYIEVIVIDKTSLTMAPGTSYTFESEIDPVNVTDPTLTWSSSDNTVATVDQSGKVTAVADGTSTITALAVGGMNATCAVTVKSPTAVANKKYVVGDADYGYGIVIGDVVWAPVNCGYEPATADCKGYPYGKLYQWGRKYGQGYDENDATYPSGDNLMEGPVTLGAGNSDENADVFFMSSEDDWCLTPTDILWNLGTETSPVRTEADPCPKGWRVPTYNELTTLYQNSLWTTNDVDQQGRYFSGEYTLIEGALQVFFPAAGYRQYNGNAKSRGIMGDYWSSRADNGWAFDIYFFNDGLYKGSIFCGEAKSVRCVQE